MRPWRAACAMGVMVASAGVRSIGATVQSASHDYCGAPQELSEEMLLRCNVLCALPRVPSDGCYIYPHDVIAGGIGAKITSLTQYIQFSMEAKCTYLHRPIKAMGHHTDAVAVERYFNIGEQCVDSEQFLQSIRLQEVHISSKDSRAGAVGKPFPPDCSEGKGVLCVLPRVAGSGRMVSKEAADLAYRVLRARFFQHAKVEENKQVTWFHPSGRSNNATSAPLNVVLHIRRGDVRAEMGHGRFTSNEDVAKVLTYLCRALQNVNRVRMRSTIAASVHVASDGTEADFPSEEWRQLLATTCPADSELVFRYDTALKTFTHFVAADVLLYGVSSFPKLAATVYHQGVSRAYAKFERTKKAKNEKVMKELGITPTLANPNPVVIEALFDLEFQEELLTFLHTRSVRESLFTAAVPVSPAADAVPVAMDDDPL